MIHARRISMGLLLGVSLTAAPTALPAGELYPVEPATFFPAGMLGLQIGNSWEASKKNPSLNQLTCEASGGKSDVFDEVCFFKTSSRISGAQIRDGFIVRKGDRMVLIGTGISIHNADDPVAEKVMRDFESQIHAKFQQAGPDVLFVNLPDKRMSAAELSGFSQTAPVLLVELEPKGNELAVFYGYLAPVNAFSAMTAD